jgi:PAS domain S-box-containing protein
MLHCTAGQREEKTMTDFFKRLFLTDGFMPHGHCYLWKPEIVWLHVISDALVALSYTTIPFTLYYFVRKRRDLPFHWMFLCFAMFIVACGATHVMEIITLWKPVFRLSGVIKAITAAASVPTAILLIRLVPQAVALPSPSDLRQANDALTQSEARFRLLLDNIGDYAIIMLDVNGCVSTWNTGAQTIHGYTTEEIQGQSFSVFFASEDASGPERALRIATSQGRYEDEGWRLRKGGGRYWGNVVLSAICNDAGDLLGFAEITRDLSERRRTEAALRSNEQRFRALSESASDGIVTSDASGAITYMNSSAETMFGFIHESALGQPLTVLMPQQFRQAHLRGVERYLATGEARVIGRRVVELTGVKDGFVEFPIELSLSTWTHGEVVTFAAIIRDVSERKRNEKLLEHTHAALQTRSTQLQVVNAELEAFSYSVAHDLRAPLRAMSGYSTTVLEAVGQDCLLEIHANAAKMGALIDALLSLSRVSRSELKPERVDLSVLVHAAEARLAAEDPSRRVEFAIQENIETEMDLPLARTLIDNLVENAWKFTRNVASPRIEFGMTEVAGERTLFVRDNGAGFDMRFVNKLFTAFQRLHSHVEFPGTGIGLATVQRIVHRHGGRIWATGSPGAGACFTFSFPARDAV